MSFNFNNTNIDKVKCNNTDVHIVRYNGTEVFRAQISKVIIDIYRFDVNYSDDGSLTDYTGSYGTVNISGNYVTCESTYLNRGVYYSYDVIIELEDGTQYSLYEINNNKDNLLYDTKIVQNVSRYIYYSGSGNWRAYNMCDLKYNLLIDNASSGTHTATFTKNTDESISYPNYSGGGIIRTSGSVTPYTRDTFTNFIIGDKTFVPTLRLAN